jgi:hypothetical protein
VSDWIAWLTALAGPVVLTTVLVQITGADRRNYVFLYMGVFAHRRRNRWLPGDTTSEVIRRLSGVDVHILRVEHGPPH